MVAGACWNVAPESRHPLFPASITDQTAHLAPCRFPSLTLATLRTIKYMVLAQSELVSLVPWHIGRDKPYLSRAQRDLYFSHGHVTKAC